MSAHTPDAQRNGESSLATAVLKRMRQVVVTYLVLGAILFVASGRLGWVWAWAYLGAGLVILVINVIILPAELIAERGQPRENVKRWDRVLTSVAGLPTLGLPIVAGLDERFGWSPPLGLAVHLLGLAVFVLGQGLFS
jgi:hypothetical protein